MSQLFKKFLFTLDPERAHKIALQSLQYSYQLGLSRFLFEKIPAAPQEVMGLTFPNRVGLSAGFDRNGEYIDALSALGFGFIEIGTVVPKPQNGNPRPRIFRLVEDEAIINRVGFASKGVDYVVKQLKKTNYRGILGINIGKNKETANENAIADYLFCFRALWKFASYITINISSPNTAGLRELQQKDFLTPLLQTLKQEQKVIAMTQQKYVPLVIKISPDLSQQELNTFAEICLQQKVDGVIAANTTLSRDGVHDSSLAKENGGLSGRPLHEKNMQIIKTLHSHLQNEIPIIASGGVMDAYTAKKTLEAGAILLQIYTGFIYQGPMLIKSIAPL